jgi:hypothetical protein
MEQDALREESEQRGGLGCRAARETTQGRADGRRLWFSRAALPWGTEGTYAHPDGAPALPGDGGPGAGDRYMEAFAEAVIGPLTGQ